MTIVRGGDKNGFTLVELLIVIAILALIAGVTIVLVINSLKDSRDSTRIQEVEAIAEALNYYALDNGSFPCEADGYNGMIGVGGTIDTLLEDYMPSVPADPTHDGSDYFYYFDAYHGCNGGPEIDVFLALMVANFETDKYLDRHGNLDQVCDYTFGSEGTSDPAYVVQLYPGCQ